MRANEIIPVSRPRTFRLIFNPITRNFTREASPSRAIAREGHGTATREWRHTAKPKRQVASLVSIHLRGFDTPFGHSTQASTRRLARGPVCSIVARASAIHKSILFISQYFPRKLNGAHRLRCEELLANAKQTNLTFSCGAQALPSAMEHTGENCVLHFRGGLCAVAPDISSALRVDGRRPLGGRIKRFPFWNAT